MEDLVGFFIIEQHVLKTTRTFRTVREVDELWDEMSIAIVQVVSDGLKGCEDSDTCLTVKVSILRFEQTLEVSSTNAFKTEYAKSICARAMDTMSLH